MNDLIIYLREIDAGTDNACWVVCARVDPDAVPFSPINATQLVRRAPNPKHRRKGTITHATRP